MTVKIELAWGERDGCACLMVGGWSLRALEELRGLSATELAHRVPVLPTELLEAGADPATLQPVAGRLDVGDDALLFVPRFPFVDGTAYSVLVNGESRTIQRPAQLAAPATEVVAIYPTTDAVPANLLKIYVYFSRPMSEGFAQGAVRVRRAHNGETLNDVFLPMLPELWDPERKRLTLLLDPGRIKRGVAKHEEAGYPLTEGVPIIVSIDSSFPDAAGQPLRSGAERRYDVGPLLREQVDLATWRVESPPAGSSAGLTVSFGRPLDHALLEHCLRVIDAGGAPVLAETTTGPGEWCWWFEPASPWRAGRYQLVVDAIQEDLAGNSLIRVFDRDLMLGNNKPSEIREMAIDFTVS
ncbi:MAG TPA: hypothetical protein VGK54_05815 [Chloroflexota bacterium]